MKIKNYLSQLTAFTILTFIFLLGMEVFAKEKDSISFYTEETAIDAGKSLHVTLNYTSSKQQMILVKLITKNNIWVANGQKVVKAGKGIITIDIYAPKQVKEGEEYIIQCHYMNPKQKVAEGRPLATRNVVAKKQNTYLTALSNLVINGGFEATDLSQWETRGNAQLVNNNAYQGQKAVALGDKAYISQKIPIEPFKLYKVTVYGKLANINKPIKVGLKGSKVEGMFSYIESENYQLHHFIFLSNALKSREATLFIESQGSGGMIDNIAVTSIPHPFIKRSDKGLFAAPEKHSLKFFDHITSDEGLSQNAIMAVYQDNQGFMWFGTFDGLNKYDGYGFTVYKREEGKKNQINSNLVYSIDEDRNGNIWIGTNDEGISCLDKVTQQFTYYKHDENDLNSLGHNHIRDHMIDSKNRLWIGHHNGIDMMDLSVPAKERKFVKIKPIGNPRKNFQHRITKVFETSKGDLWFGSFSALIYKLQYHSSGEPYLQPFHVGGSEVRDLDEDKNGNLIVGTNVGIHREFKDSTTGQTFFMVQGGAGISSFTYDKENDIIWAGTHRGLLEYKVVGNSIKLVARYVEDIHNEHSLNNNEIREIFKDNQGILWVGTYSGGINKLDLKRKPFYHISRTPEEGSLLDNSIRGLLYDSKGGLWLGTGSEGVSYLSAEKADKNFDKFEYIKSIPKTFVIEEVKTIEGQKVILGSRQGDGLYTISLENNTDLPLNQRIKNYPYHFSAIFDIFQDSHENIWIGSYSKGLFRVKPDLSMDEVFHIPYEANKQGGLCSHIIRNIVEDQEGNIWVGTGSGLNKIEAKDVNSNNPYLHVYQNKVGDNNSLSNNYVLELYVSKDGTLWIGTMGGGLNKYVPKSDKSEEHFVRYTTKHGLPNNTIKSILEDEKGNLWLSTNYGLAKFNPQTEEVKNFDQNDGLQDNEFQDASRTVKKDGTMIFGGVNGFSMFHPDHIEDNKDKPKIAFTRLMLLNKLVNAGDTINGNILLEKDIALTKELTFHHTENSFSLEFTALHYASPHKNQYAYKLEGFDKEWIRTSSDKRWVTYTNLDAGDYTLKVKASNNDGIWNEEGISMQIVVLPPWWETWYFRLFAVALLIIASVSYYKYKVFKYKKNQKVLEKLVKERTSDLEQANNDIVSKNAVLQEQAEELQVQRDSLEKAHNDIVSKNAILQEQAEELQVQRDSLEKSNLIISQNNEQIVASIRYAKSIQKAMLPSFDEMSNNFVNHFVLYKPKDIVSGDFYWTYQTGEHRFIVVADCTGHGVPGAFMSMIGNSLLNRIIKENGITEVNTVLKHLNREIHAALKQSESHNDDGMDMVICRLTPNGTGTYLEFAGAKNPLYYYSSENNSVNIISGSKKSIGGVRYIDHDYEKEQLKLQNGDKLYLISDGILDQNREDRRRYGKNRFIELLEANATLSFEEQKGNIHQALSDFMGDEPQRDDITVIGISVG